MLEGLPPHRPTRLMRLAIDQNSARAITDLLGEVFDPGETAVASFETPGGDWRLEAYFANDPDERKVRELVRPLVGGKADEAVFLRLSPKDWVQASLAELKPVRAGRLLVHGSHDDAAPRANDIGIKIDAALAFGTGHHGSTLGCLAALVALLKQRRPKAVLDVGTGTGILAIAAAKLLRRRVVAGDVDPVAVAVARANARANGAQVRTFAGPGVRHALARRRAHFDLVFANILAGPIQRLAPQLRAVVHRNGAIVLSGLLARDVPGVLAAYGAQHLHLRSRSERDGWVTLILRREGAAQRRKPLGRGGRTIKFR